MPSVVESEVAGLTSKRPFRVLVTGFGPFPDGKGGRHVDNASHMVSQLLPAGLSTASTDVEIVTLPSPLRTEYAYARFWLDWLHSSTKWHFQEVDFYIHLGMAVGWDYVSVERGAYKQGREGYYTSHDDAGKSAAPSPWADDVPEFLPTGLDVDALIDGLEKGGNGLPVKPHAEPGTYLCGFSCFESLAGRWKRGRSANVVFLHVPEKTDKESLGKARDSVVNIIGGIAEQWTAKHPEEAKIVEGDWVLA